MHFQQLLGILATGIAFYGYVPYFRDIHTGKTKPHAISWLIWGLLTAIGFFGQISDSAGAGAWVTGFSAFVCLVIFAIALKYGEKHITRTDWWCLIAAGIALLLLGFSKTPLLSVILSSVVGVIGYIPTFRKSYSKPFEETLITYFLSGLKFFIALFALTNISLLTTLFIASQIFMNWLLVGMLVIWRKRVL